MELTSEQLDALNTVMQALSALPARAKVRTVVVDVEQRYGWERVRVRITGARSKYDKTFRVVEIKSMG